MIRFLLGRRDSRRQAGRAARGGTLRDRPRGLEPLEPRAMLAADAGLAADGGLGRLEWQGRVVDVVADHWIARAASPRADLPLAAGWQAESLGEGFFSLTAPGAGVADVLGWAAATPAVAYVEPDFAISSTAFSNDPSFGSLWGLHNTGQSGGLLDADIDAPEAWDSTTGSRRVVIAVIDTGVDYTHPDLAPNAWRNPGEVAGDRIDNDKNGFVDDVYGWDFANGDADPMDDNGHGTHVAGTIGAAGDNGIGVVGVNWQVSIMPLKFLSASGRGSTSGAVAAVNYATSMKRDFRVNVVATNNSWGGGGFSTALADAIAAAGRQNILFVAAAGNEAADTDASPHYPSTYDDSAVISVAASDRSNHLASFSNYGATSVDLVAPGVSIVSTLPGNRYGSYTGTSMATPHVTGVVGLLAAANPAATAAEIRAAILTTTTPVTEFAGRTVSGGLLNAAAAVAAILAPAPPPVDPPPVDPGDPGTGSGDPDPPPKPPPIEDVGQVCRDALRIQATTGDVRLSGVVGDGPFAASDVDMYRVRVKAGHALVIDVDAWTLPGGSMLDSYLRVFNARGKQVAANDDDKSTADSRLTISSRVGGTFYVGVSGTGNSRYDPNDAASKIRVGSTGTYEITFSFRNTADGQVAVTAGIATLGFPDAQPRPRGWARLFTRPAPVTA